jgi:hypothetical protein
MKPLSHSTLDMPRSSRAFLALPFAIAAGLLLLPVTTARADIGQKPTMDFSFEYQIDPVDIVEGQLIECEDANCENGRPLEQIGPQHFTCMATSCSSMAYSYADYHKLIVTFADRTRESNVFSSEAYEAAFKVIVLESSLQVEEVRKGIGVGRCCPALAATIALEVAVAIIYLGAFRLPRAILGWVGLSSILTLPIVQFVFPRLPLPGGWIVGLSEGFAVLFEAGLIYLAARRAMPLKHAAALSLVMNGVSFAVGLLLSL